jgi:hypothetical protein
LAAFHPDEDSVASVERGWRRCRIAQRISPLNRATHRGVQGAYLLIERRARRVIANTSA